MGREDFAAAVTENDLESLLAPQIATPCPLLVRASQVEYEPPRWLIAPYFQRGKGTLIQGDNGVGKTAFICAIAAHVSTGEPLLGLPVETPGRVLVLSVEDDLPVLRGRIEASGGNLDNCLFFPEAAGLTFNSPQVEAALQERKLAAAYQNFTAWREGLLNRMCQALRVYHQLKLGPQGPTPAQAAALSMGETLEHWYECLAYGRAKEQLEIYRDKEGIEAWVEKILQP